MKAKKTKLFAAPRMGWVLVAREESNFLTDERKGDWGVAWIDVFGTKKAALAFAKENNWPKPYRAVRGALVAF